MKKYSIDHFKGFPFGLDDIKNMGDNSIEAATAVGLMISQEMQSDFIWLSGLEISTPAPGQTAIAPGFVIHLGELRPVAGITLVGTFDIFSLHLKPDLSQEESILWGDAQVRPSITGTGLLPSSTAATGSFPMENLRKYQHSVGLTGDIDNTGRVAPTISRVGNRVSLHGDVYYNAGASAFYVELTGADAVQFAPLGNVATTGVVRGVHAHGYYVDGSSFVEVKCYYNGVQLRIEIGNTDTEVYRLSGINYLCDV